MKQVLVAGENRFIDGTRLEISIQHGGHAAIEHAVAVLPKVGPDRAWLPLQDEAPAYASEVLGPTSFHLDLSRLHPDTDRVQLVLQAAGAATTLSPFGWVRAGVGAFAIELAAGDLAVACIAFAELYRKDGRWKIRAKKEGMFEGIEALGRLFGLTLHDRSRDRAKAGRGDDRAAPPREWGGSGFLVAEGLVITNAHVVDGAGSVLVSGFAGRHEAEPVLIDGTNDLALIRIARPGATACLPFRSHPGPMLGEQAISIGFPLAGILGSGAKLGEGIVSGLLGPDDDARTFQVTSPIQPGSSGGPILDAGGRVIGVVASTLKGAQNVNLAIRASLAAALLEAANVPARYAGEGAAVTMAALARDCVPLVWRLECRA